LRDGFGGGVALRDLDQLRRFQQLVGKLLDFAGERCGEQEVLAFRRGGKQRHDALDVGNEPHVQHPIGFVEHENLDLAQVHALLLDVIEQSSGGRDQDLDAGAHDRQLLLDVDAAVHDGGTQLRVLAVGLEGLLDLHRELAGGREDQRAHGVPRR
jgi:hypothetical protein